MLDKHRFEPRRRLLTDISKMREIGKIVLNPNIADLRSRTIRALLFALLAYQPYAENFDLNLLAKEFERKFGLKKFPKLLLMQELDALAKESIVSIHNGGWSIGAETAKDIESQIESSTKTMSDCAEEFSKYVERRTGSLDDYQKIFVRSALERIVSGLLVRLGETAARFFTGQSLPASWEDLREIIAESLEEVIEPEIEKSEIIKAAIGPSFEEALLEPTDLFAVGLAQIASAYVMLRVLNADPELRRFQRDLFSDCTLFLDTNVLIAHLCKASDRHEYTKWLLDATRSLGTRLCVSERTLREFGHSLEYAGYAYRKYHRRQLSEELLSNEVVRTYLQFHRNDTEWGEFAEQLRKDLMEMLQDYSVNVTPFTDADVDSVQLANVHRFIDEATSRGLEGRAYDVVEHDAYCLLLVQKIRMEDPDAPFSSPWFLTHDYRLRKADSTVREKWNFALEGALGPEEWFEIIYPFLGPEMRTERSSTFFSMMIAGTMLPLPPVSVEAFISYLATELDLPSEDEETLLRVIEANRLEAALGRELSKGNIPIAIDKLYEGIANVLRYNRELIAKTETVDRLVSRNKELAGRIRELEGSFAIETEILKEHIDKVEVATTNQEKKESLEDLGEYLLESLAGWKCVGTGLRTGTSELDLVMENSNRVDPFLMKMGPNILVECKNWRRPVGSEEIRDFGRDLQKRRIEYGILISREGITGDPGGRKDARGELWDFFRDGTCILVLSLGDILEVANGAHLIAILRMKDRDLRLIG